MGLDLVEYVIALEGAFAIEIPDADAARLETPRLLIDYLAGRLPTVDAPGAATCLSQRAFYRVRAAAARRFGVPRPALRPRSPLRELLSERADEWKQLGKDVGARDWPPLKSERWPLSAFGGVSTLGEAAAYLADYDTATLRGPASPWTRAEIEALALRLLERETGVDMSRYTLDSRFVRDMGLD